MTSEQYAQTFHALGDKTRFRLFQILGEKKEICVGQLAEELGITSACVSQHMKILTEAGLVRRIREGQRVCYEVSTDSQMKQLAQSFNF
jgi:ArsR family transcriptional regulator